ncbi:MAG: four helix bundle protein [Anaerolineae bacterium]|jgi:four helix bundle protein|nr:four helix bundle protein [Anaerolineae bacterium]MBT7991266.1 four helix bundle protein [Anaerolineae bacterium]
MDVKKEPVTLRVRTKDFALRIIRLYRTLPKSGEASVIGRQILRSGTSVGAQYREAYRAKSPRDFINKMEGSLQELDETAFWIELLIEAEIMPEERMSGLAKETDELIAIFVSSINTAKKNNKK